jgi:transcriptional regulator with XRE-family HTH domain
MIVMTQIQTRTLGQFIQTEMDKRKMSARAFARLLGVDSKTINKFLDYGSKDVGYPSVDFLLKLSQATKADICYIMTLIDPNITLTAQVNPVAVEIGRQIEELPAHVRNTIDDLILGASLNSRQDSD